MRFEVVTGPGLDARGRDLAERAERALAAVAVTAVQADQPTVHEPAGEDVVRLLVEPATWLPPTADGDGLGRSIVLSTAAYGSEALIEDLARGAVSGGLALVDPRAAEVAELELDVPVAAVPIGTTGGPADGPRPVAVATCGSEARRRLRLLALAAPRLDALPCEHRFVDGDGVGAPPSLPELLGRAVIFADLADDEQWSEHPIEIVVAAEQGALPITERAVTGLPEAARELVLRAPAETLLWRAAELAARPSWAAERAAALAQALADAWPLSRMGETLADLGRRVLERPLPVERGPLPAPHRPPSPRPLVEHLRAAQAEPDAHLRAGIQRVLTGLQQLERRVARIERSGDGDDRATAVERLTGERATPPTISLIVPCFQAAATLRETLDAAAAAIQPLVDRDPPVAVEVIVVDDGSHERESEIVREWAAERQGVAVVLARHAINRGLGAARNTGLELARGELVLPLDADNLLWPLGLQRLHDALVADPGAALAYGILQEFDAGGPVGLRGRHPWQPERFRYGNYVDALALVRTAALREAGGYTEQLSVPGFEDWDLWCRFVERDLRGAWVPQPVAGYRIRAGAMSDDFHLSYVRPFAEMIERHPGLFA
ncbi:Glycosyltransferase [Patulibacter medicamentivorans]|uniref:Glycosyltransferase n=1 Tax=Patulibacter medicamentivorans TaxID=1097667 RepID=H0E5S4_9ACTN|nr:glycosyltransferase family 2 protein [Patulibacter medicamentivorans]EHN10975.1 Glycosyltransferase [Patulibacter medicamentivorans]